MHCSTDEDKFGWVVFVPAAPGCQQRATQGNFGVGSPRVRVHLLEFDLVLSYRLAFGVEDEEPRARCAIVNGSDERVSCLTSVNSRCLP